jgi:pimeloyl-ACP methyl ester carboxylesterase
MKGFRLAISTVIVLSGVGMAACASSRSGSDRDVETGKLDEGKTMRAVTSRDGTRIAYDRSGQGPAVILVGGALATRADGAELALLLASRFTVYSYDRRGRGDSTDTRPYAVEREIEDLSALIDEAGGSARVYGKSSGACLALRATAALGAKVTRLALYEAPYDEAEGAAAEWQEYRSKLDGLLAADRRGDAVTLFLTFVGMPEETLAGMKASPAWPRMEALAPTLAYDTAVLGDDRSIPVDQAARIQTATLVMDGGASLETMPFMRPSAEKLAKVIPNAQRRTIEGQGHDVSSKVLAPVLVEFFSGDAPR